MLEKIEMRTKVLMMMVKKENENWKNIAKLMMVVTREKMKLEQS